MAAPTPTARGTPSGRMLENQFRTKITLARNTTISFWEQTVKPPGMTSRGKIQISTMFNSEFHTFAPKKLIEVGDITGKAAYDPAVATQIRATMRIPDTITVTHPDGSTEAHFGYLDEWMPGENVTDDGFPLADFKICVTSWDHTNEVEAGPVITSVTGT